MEESRNTRLSLSVPRQHVKTVKKALEYHDVIDRTRKITPEELVLSHEENGQNNGVESLSAPRMVIPTRIPYETWTKDPRPLVWNVLREVVEAPELDIRMLETGEDGRASTERNPVVRAIGNGLKALPDEVLMSIEISVAALVSGFPGDYSIYKPMLLLPHNTFSSAPWTKLLSSQAADSPTLQPIWKEMANTVGCTHVAINAGIPLRSNPDCSKPLQSNILRSPLNITPIYGDFGPPPTPQTLANPTTSDFASAFWVSTTQNGIHQTWAPLYTMFSRGNIREKTRILNLPSVHTSISEGKGKGKTQATAPGHRAWRYSQNEIFQPGCTAVDLYAGIGYFAFSYKKAGVSKVFCWELNPWSVEGLRRGAAMNGWTTQMFTKFPMDIVTAVNDQVDFLIFQQSNDYAFSLCIYLNQERERPGLSTFPPIRHVNCGFLPSSSPSWRTAVKIIDNSLGGWIHAHENVGVNDIDVRKDEVAEEMQRCLDEWEGERGACGSYCRHVRCEHIERVKTYAPGVVHVVFDVWVDGMRDAEDML